MAHCGRWKEKILVRQKILENGLDNTIYTHGSFDVSEMPAILANADALLLSLRNNPNF